MGKKSLKTVQKARLKTSILKKRLSPHNIKLDKNPQSNSTWNFLIKNWTEESISTLWKVQMSPWQNFEETIFSNGTFY